MFTEVCCHSAAVNDPFVMGAWGESAGAGGKVGPGLHAQLPMSTAAPCCRLNAKYLGLMRSRLKPANFEASSMQWWRLLQCLFMQIPTQQLQAV